VPIVNRSLFESVELAVAPTPEQHLVADNFIRLENRLRKEQDYATKLRTLKHGLMDDLLTGRVRVNVNEEDA